VEKIFVRRTLPPLVLDRSPLVYFLAQVRFSPILAMIDHVNHVQERLRKIGYPHFSRVDTFNVAFTPPTPPSVEKKELWTFSAADRKTGITISNNFVSFQAVDYQRYEDSLPKIIEALKAVDDVAQIGLFERVGLRYLDVIAPNWGSGESFSTYLRPEMIGISGAAINVETLMHNTAYVGRTELGGTLVVRFTTSEAPNVLPADLAGANLEIPKLGVRDGIRIGILDFDHYVESSERFSVALAQTTLSELHDAIARAFNECATDKARELWGKHEAI
jgi:uncharacterized protein (TIGR04255 family)